MRTLTSEALLASRLRERVGRRDDALSLLYEARRRYFQHPDAHLKYIGFFFTHPGDDGAVDIPEVVPDTSVLLREGKRSQWYTIEDRPDARPDLYELPLTHELAERLLGHKRGEAVDVKKGSITTRTVTIAEIKPKFVHALHESLRLFETLFPSAQGIEGVDLAKNESGEDGIDIAPILRSVKDRQAALNQVLDMYRAGKLTIGALAELSGETPVATWWMLARSASVGLRSSSGSPDERRAALSLLESDSERTLVVDAVALMTLFATGAKDLVACAYGRLGIAQTTIDVLQEAIEREEVLAKTGGMTLGYENGQFVRTVLSARDVAKNLEFLNEILVFARTQCDVLPVKATLALSPQRKAQLNRSLVSCL